MACVKLRCRGTPLPALLGLLLQFGATVCAQNNPWRAPAILPQNFSITQRWVQPQVFIAFDLDRDTLSSTLKHRPGEAKLEETSPTIILPMPDGTFEKFRFIESSVMSPQLAAKFPELRTFAGQGMDNPELTVRFDSTTHGFHAQIISPAGAAYIEPYMRGNPKLHVCYFKKDYPTAAKDFQCLSVETSSKPSAKTVVTSTAAGSSNSNLRTYRLACAATAEYTTYFGGTVLAAMSAIVTAVNRINGIYEAEIGIRLLLVDNNNLIVYTNSATDPYTDNSPSLLLSQNQSNLDF